MTITELLMFLAVLVQVVLTLVLYTRLVNARFKAVGGGGLDASRLSWDQGAWPERPRIAANAVQSQFELPVLFYVAVLFCFSPLGPLNWLTVILAWAFVIFRIVHAAIHTGANQIKPRLTVFILGYIVIILFWVYLAFHFIRGWLLLA